MKRKTQYVIASADGFYNSMDMRFGSIFGADLFDTEEDAEAFLDITAEKARNYIVWIQKVYKFIKN